MAQEVKELDPTVLRHRIMRTRDGQRRREALILLREAEVISPTKPAYYNKLRETLLAVNLAEAETEQRKKVLVSEAKKAPPTESKRHVQPSRAPRSPRGR